MRRAGVALALLALFSWVHGQDPRLPDEFSEAHACRLDGEELRRRWTSCKMMVLLVPAHPKLIKPHLENILQHGIGNLTSEQVNGLLMDWVHVDKEHLVGWRDPGHAAHAAVTAAATDMRSFVPGVATLSFAMAQGRPAVNLPIEATTATPLSDIDPAWGVLKVGWGDSGTWPTITLPSTDNIGTKMYSPFCVGPLFFAARKGWAIAFPRSHARFLPEVTSPHQCNWGLSTTGRQTEGGRSHPDPIPAVELPSLRDGAPSDAKARAEAPDGILGFGDEPGELGALWHHHHSACRCGPCDEGRAPPPRDPLAALRAAAKVGVAAPGALWLDGAAAGVGLLVAAGELDLASKWCVDRVASGVVHCRCERSTAVCTANLRLVPLLWPGRAEPVFWVHQAAVHSRHPLPDLPDAAASSRMLLERVSEDWEASFAASALETGLALFPGDDAALREAAGAAPDALRAALAQSAGRATFAARVFPAVAHLPSEAARGKVAEALRLLEARLAQNRAGAAE
ncbi:hypothetical protein HT031_006005 [Scenedesmus sp. PABB004]|nr:hypothetical protein HT031_006005 [Scenedesmus sp. PABB004]